MKFCQKKLDDMRFVNLSRNEMDATLAKGQAQLKNGSYDRFFLFILSHGNEKGIMVHVQGKETEVDEGNEFPVSKIIEKFNSAKLPKMRGYPKCIFLQACRGEGFTSFAGKSDADDTFTTQATPDFPTTSILMANGSDMLLCYPSEAGYYSFLSGSGSFLVQEVITAIKRYYRTEHLLDMLTEASRHVSKTKRKFIDKKGEQRDACQMPHIVTTLTRKFFLYLEQ